MVVEQLHGEQWVGQLNPGFQQSAQGT